MNIKTVHSLPLAASLCLLSGCVGYNHALFMTKSNVGLDFDTKPPTLEVTVARREAVIAPSFEGGKTPPVMASFGTRSGTGSTFSSFFFGVNQTFAGGDSAMAMARLYADPEIGTNNLAHYDSAFDISKVPRQNLKTSRLRRFLFGLPGPGESRPFVFGTDTSLGVKVVWTGDTAYVPDAVKVGFNRKEFALAPVYLKTNSGAATETYSVKMPAFLATVDSDFTSKDENASVGTIQYFATGDTATLLALQPGVRKAMLARMDPLADEKTKELSIDYADTDAGAKTREWAKVKPADVTAGKTAAVVRKERQKEMKDWIKARGKTYSFTDLLYNKELESEREAFNKAKNIN